MTDQAILDCFQRGDSRTPARYLYGASPWRELVRQHVIKNNGTPADADEIVQETIVAFTLNLMNGKYRSGGPLERYFLAIARNLWLKNLRYQRQQRAYGEYKLWRASAQRAEELFGPDWRDELEHVQTGMQHLSERKRNILSLAAHELSHAEIARRTKLANEASSRTSLKRARQDLMAQLRKLSPLMLIIRCLWT
jgi:RNA polymerase sigma factor (sigma-70 family)